MYLTHISYTKFENKSYIFSTNYNVKYKKLKAKVQFKLKN